MKSETRLQQECFQWHWNTFPQFRGLLNHNLNNAKDARTGKLYKSMGVIRGRADFTYYAPNGKAVFIELKTEKGTQQKDQVQWELLVKLYGYQYWVVRSLEEFQMLIDQIHSDYEINGTR